MLIIQGPFPANTDAVVLPSPLETNTEGLTSTVQTIRMMDGSVNTYVKRKNLNKRFRWQFLVGFKKAREIEDFVEDNNGDKVLVTWRNSVHVGYITLNPLDMRGEVSEFYNVTIEFEEKP